MFIYFSTKLMTLERILIDVCILRMRKPKQKLEFKFAMIFDREKQL